MTPWAAALQAPLSMEFPKQEYWSGLLFPSPGDLPNPGVEPASPAVQVDSLPLTYQRSPVPGTGNKFLKFCFPCLTFPGDSDSKESDCNVGELDSIPESGRSPGEGNGYPLPFFPGESMEREAWWATVHGVVKSWREVNS